MASRDVMPVHRIDPPLVSVVMPAFNTAAFIGVAIGSALAQTVSDLEILVADDGSTDATCEIVRDLSRRDPRVRLLTGDNTPQVSQGPSAARNRAIRAARGRYIALLDSDDLWLPGFLETQLSAFAQFPDADIVTGNVRDLGGAHDGRPYRAVAANRRRLSLLEIIEREDVVCIMSVFRREVADVVDGFDEAIRPNEDYDFWLRAAAADLVFVQTSEPMGWYRRRPGSASADPLKMIVGIEHVYEKARTYCADRPVALAAIERQLLRFRREELAIRARAALRRQRFGPAAAPLRKLQQRHPGLARTLLAAGCRCVPGAVILARRLRRASRVSIDVLRASPRWLFPLFAGLIAPAAFAM